MRATLLACAAGLLFSVCAASQPAPTLRVRRDVHSLDPNGPEIAALKRGVAAMKARAATDPTSWAYQGAIHGTDTPGNAAGWNSCQHGSFFFLSWHRMYLHFFERILRSASGDPTLTLPYWNYSKPGQNSLPVPLRRPATLENPLFEPARDAAANGGATFPSSATGSSRAMSLTRFSSAVSASRGFGGRIVSQPVHFSSAHGAIESQPHDNVHVLVGGDAGLMSDPNFAALDPVFWLHHCNIDRLWESWVARGGGRSNPTGDTAWMNTEFTFFDENRNQVRMKGSEIVNAAKQLGYGYDALEAPSSPQAVPESAPQPERMTTPKTLVTRDRKTLLEESTEVSLSLPKKALEPSGPESIGGRAVVLHIEGLKSTASSGGYWEVYLNVPKGARPDPDGPHFIGTIAFFGRKHAHDPGAPSTQDFEVTEVVERLRREKKLEDGKLNLSFVRRTIDAGAAVPAPGPAPALPKPESKKKGAKPPKEPKPAAAAKPAPKAGKILGEPQFTKIRVEIL